MKNLINKMKFNAIIWVAIIGLALQLSSCNKEKKVKTKSHPDKEIIASDTIFDRESPYYIFIQKNNPKAIKGKVLFFKEKDIDLDGLNEAIVAFGENTSRGPHIKNLFVLKNDHGIVKQVICYFNLNDSAFHADEVSLISLQGKQQSYICVNYISKLLSRGVSVFELTNNHLESICQTELSGLKDEYIESLIDKNDDGEYDGYLRRYIKDDKLRYFRDTESVFENGIFKAKETQNFINRYPDNVQDVLLQYIRLRSLSFTDGIVNYRLDELCSDKEASLINWNKKWYYLSPRTDFQIENNINVDFLDIQENDDKASVTATYNLEEEKDVKGIYQLQFELEKTADKWKITKVEILK